MIIVYFYVAKNIFSSDNFFCKKSENLKPQLVSVKNFCADLSIKQYIEVLGKMFVVERGPHRNFDKSTFGQKTE